MGGEGFDTLNFIGPRIVRINLTNQPVRISSAITIAANERTINDSTNVVTLGNITNFENFGFGQLPLSGIMLLGPNFFISDDNPHTVYGIPNAASRIVFQGNGGNDTIIATAGTAISILDFSNVDGNNDKIDYREYQSGTSISINDLNFSNNSLSLKIGISSDAPLLLINAFNASAGGVLSGYTYTDDTTLTNDFRNSTNGINSSDYFIF